MAAVVAAVVLVALVLFGGAGGGYVVKAEFHNAGQLVEGNLVQVGGTKAGTVDKIEVSKDGQAIVTMKVEKPYAPLRHGTKAIIRQASLSGIANRYVDIQLPATRSSPAGQRNEEIPDGGTIAITETTTAVDLDQLFNTLDPVTRVAVQDFLKGSARQYKGYGRAANRGFQYLNPSLSTSRRLFNELNADTPVLERFIVDSAKFMTAVAERRDDLAALIGNLNQTTRALGNQKLALAEAIRAFPEFMRSANGTFVSLRSTLDDVDPLVEASKPVAPRLNAFLREAQPFARDARPTVRSLNNIIRQPGADNDLTELNRLFPPLARVALDRRRQIVNTQRARPCARADNRGCVDVGRQRGAFPEMKEALEKSAPIIGFGRPYTVDLFGWFDDFSTTGLYDALGGISRTQAYFNVNSPAGGPPLIDVPDDPTTPEDESINNLNLRGETFRNFAQYDEYKRCPGASEEAARDRSNVWTGRDADFDRDGSVDCLEEDRATGNTE